MAKVRKRGVGRPPKPDGAWRQVAIRFPAEMIDALDHISATRMARPDRSELVREAVAKLIEQEAV